METIVCPHCKKEVELSAAIFHEMEEKISQDLKFKQATDLEKIKKETEEKVRQELTKENSAKFENSQKDNEKLNKRNDELFAELKQLNETIRELKDSNRNLKLETEKRLNEELEKVKESENQKAKLEKLELEKQLSDTRKALEEAQRKSKQGSQQLQGEVLELDLEDQLRASFPHDQIEPVAKGSLGADVWQKVGNSHGQIAGSILWELKRTKAWSTGWLAKLREDMRAISANSAVLISDVLPDGVKHFGLVEGVWVTTYSYALPLATVLRTFLLQIAIAKTTAANKDEKLEELYRYITSQTFLHRVEAQVEAAVELQNDLETEKRSALRVWKKRELQIKRLIGNTSSMYGELQGVAGGALPTIKSLDGPAVDESETQEDLFSENSVEH